MEVEEDGTGFGADDGWVEVDILHECDVVGRCEAASRLESA